MGGFRYSFHHHQSVVPRVLRALASRDLLAIFLLALSFRLLLLFLFPVPYGNDAAGRLYFRDTLWIGHWLPLTQGLVNATFTLTHSVVAVRLVFALTTSLAAVAFAYYLQHIAGRRVAVIGGVLFATNAQLTTLSLMPFQEVIFLGLLFGGLAFWQQADANSARRYHFIVGAGLYGLACLTRYEAWFILPVLAVAHLWRSHRRQQPWPRAILEAVAGFGWAPLLWLLINQITYHSPLAFLFHRPDRAFYAWQPHSELQRIFDYLVLMGYWLLRFGSPLVLLAIPGAFRAWQHRRTLWPRLWPLLLLAGLSLLFLTLVAGREFATANRFVALPLSVLLIFTAIGAGATLDYLQALPQWPGARGQRWLCAGLLLLLLIYGGQPVAQANRLSQFRTPYEIAQFLRANISAGERAIVLAESIDGAVPMAYQRIFGQLTLKREVLLCAALLDSISAGTAGDLLQRLQIRYVVYVAGERPLHPNDYQILAALHTANAPVRFRHHDAAIYEW